MERLAGRSFLAVGTGIQSGAHLPCEGCKNPTLHGAEEKFVTMSSVLEQLSVV